MSWKCENCKWENADKWENCANCGKPSGLPPKIQTREDKIFKYLAISLMVIFFIIVFVLLDTVTGMMPQQPTPTPEIANKYQAHKICTQFIEQLLKAPSTAQFESMFDSTYKEISNVQYEVWLYVDAQNSFGAMLRNDYYCKVTYLPDIDKWYLDDLVNLDDK